MTRLQIQTNGRTYRTAKRTYNSYQKVQGLQFNTPSFVCMLVQNISRNFQKVIIKYLSL